MNYAKRTKLFTGLMAGVVVLSITSMLGFFMMFLNREHLRQNLNNVKLEKERTQSEKMLVDKDLTFLQREFSRLDAANQQLSNLLNRTEEQVIRKDITIDQLSRDTQELGRIKSNLSDLKINHTQIEQQVNQLSKSIDVLIQRNNQLINRMNEMDEEQERLRLEYEKAMVHKGIGRAFRVDALRGERLTIKAKRTRNLAISFEPIDRNEFMKLRNETFYVVLTDQSGAVYNLMKSEKATIYLKGNAVDLMPSFTLEAAPNADRINRISLELTQLDLKPGIYNFEVYTSKAFVGNTQIRLN
jgi:Tfp pilus assembly protein PilN